MPTDMKDRPFHPNKPGPEQAERHARFNNRFEELAAEMTACGEPSREKSLALTKLEEAALWFNKHIAFRVGED